MQDKSARHSSRAYLYPRIASKGLHSQLQNLPRGRIRVRPGKRAGGRGRQCIRCIYVGGLIARELTVSTGSYLARQFLLLQSTTIYPARAGVAS